MDKKEKQDFLCKIYDLLMGNYNMPYFDCDTDIDYGFMDCGKMEIVFVVDDREIVLSLTERPYED